MESNGFGRGGKGYTQINCSQLGVSSNKAETVSTWRSLSTLDYIKSEASHHCKLHRIMLALNILFECGEMPIVIVITSIAGKIKQGV